MGTDREERRRVSWAARILAPIALLAAVATVAMVVDGSLDGADGDEADLEERSGRTIEGCTPTEPEALSQGYYVVQPGEPGLSAVTAKTCVPIERIVRLNPDLDPQLIREQQCVNLRRDACQAQAEG